MVGKLFNHSTVASSLSLSSLFSLPLCFAAALHFARNRTESQRVRTHYHSTETCTHTHMLGNVREFASYTDRDDRNGTK
uniref:Putative secreted protein n=1 Tax=Anopheles darlingi TaxID=43151 RepID=A0A2M4DNL2_ANODA